YQLEAINPFTNGNGRRGRILNSLLLIEKGLWDLPILYLGRSTIENRGAYYRLLLGVTERQDWESWIIYILDGLADTADWTVSKLDSIRRLFEQTRQHIRTHAQGIYTHELVNLLFEQPYT
ncbi:hypothetical protein CWI44_00005, partial [Neisseria meningitidis]|uniref:Fic family protein n=1 Tax=Neisseria meningitidis TaxID=487 RepID=UPI000CB6F596